VKTRHQRQLGFGGPLKIDRLDHLVLTVKDIEATFAFYARVLGMDVITFGSGRERIRDLIIEF